MTIRVFASYRFRNGNLDKQVEPHLVDLVQSMHKAGLKTEAARYLKGELSIELKDSMEICTYLAKQPAQGEAIGKE